MLVIRAGCVLAIAAAFAAVSPASAVASSLQPAVSATLTDLGVAKDGSHHARLDWSGTCGPDAPADATIGDSAYYAVMHVARRAGGQPSSESQIPLDALNGSADVTAYPGRNVFGRVVLVCTDDAGDEARAQADSPQRIFPPPRIQGFSAERVSYCNVPYRKQKNGVGADDFQTLAWTLDFGRDSMLQSPSVAGMLKEIRLRASGKQLKLRVPPQSGPLRVHGLFQATFYSPPSGRITLWAEIGGVATNRITIPVLGTPCVRDPKRYYGTSRGQINRFVRD